MTGPLIDVPGGEELRVLMVISRPAGLADVDFQMVARPLHERLRPVGGEVRLEVARPPTLAALEDCLEQARAAGRAYHALHFDGHGVFSEGGGAPGMYDLPGTGGAGYLLFETEAGDEGHRVTAGDFAQVIKRAGVPLVVLNACQSTTMGGTDATTGATVATRLLEEGVRSVVAMSHSVYAVAAAEFMAAFYDALFRGRSVLEATTAGRLQLSRNPDRPSPRATCRCRTGQCRCSTPGRTCTSRRSPRSRPRPPRRPVARRHAGRPARRRDPGPGGPGGGRRGIAAEAGIFVGRGAEFYTLELAARRQTVTVIHGPGGTGKTELAKGFARWWRDTGGTENPGLVFFHSFEPGLSTFGLHGVLIGIGNAIFQTDLLARTTPEERRDLRAGRTMEGSSACSTSSTSSRASAWRSGSIGSSSRQTSSTSCRISSFSEGCPAT